MKNISRLWLRRAIPLTLSIGMFSATPVSLPSDLSSYVPSISVTRAEAAVQRDLQVDLSPWKYGGQYSYRGAASVQPDAAFGGTLRVDADYRANKTDDWSEIKLEYGKEIDLTGCNQLSFTLRLKPSDMTSGSFKVKLYAKSGEREVLNVIGDVSLDGAKQEADGFISVPVQVTFPKVEGKTSCFCLSIVGSRTDYHGALYFGDLSLNSAVVSDGYVERSVRPISSAEKYAAALNLPASVRLSDSKATPETANLYAYLRAVADAPQVLYGHQNDLHRKVAKNLPGASDTWDLTGDNAAVMGMDTLALTGDELELTDAERKAGKTFAKKLAEIYLPSAQQGAILTMSAHMPNFAKVAARPKVDGKYDFSGYSPNDLSGDVVERILPGGDLNAVYTAYLDLIADFDRLLADAGVPLLLRPFHENNGSWFWWGASSCTPSQYKNLYRYTVEYLRQEKGLHNLIMVYSPNGPFQNADELAERYPGDAWVDAIGLDFYHRSPATEDHWMDALEQSLDVLENFAQAHDKCAVLSEVGIIAQEGGCLARTGNMRPNWFEELLARTAGHRIPYLLTWSNFDESNFCQPYLVTKTRGHEMADDFTRFYNSPQTLFARQTMRTSGLHTAFEAVAAATGYLVSHHSFERIDGATDFVVKTIGATQSVRVMLSADGGQPLVLTAAQGADGYFHAPVDQATIEKFGQTLATVAVSINDKEMDSVRVLLNTPAPVYDPYLVDDFEEYYGDQGLLTGAYSKNCGAGSDVIWHLSKEHAAEGTGLSYHYQLAKGGYAGIIKNLKGADWSKANAVEFWIQPDGKAQRLIIQINSGGEDFEAFLQEVASSTNAQRVRIPFDRLKGKNGGTFDPKSIRHFAIYCNADGDTSVESTMYFDDIRAVK